MFQNYFKIALRNLLRHKIYSVINIAGLAVGIAAGLLILLYVHDELSFDRWHRQADRIVRVIHQRDLSGTFERLATTPLVLAPQLSSEFPEVEIASSTSPGAPSELTWREKICSKP